MLTTKRTVKAPAATKNTIRTVTGKLSPVWGTSLSEEFEGLSVVLDSVPFGEDGFSEGGVGSDGLVGSVSVPVAGINVTSFTASQFMQWIDLLPSSVAVGSLSMVNSVSQLWPVASISRVSTSLQTEHVRCSLPFSVQVGAVMVSHVPKE